MLQSLLFRAGTTANHLDGVAAESGNSCSTATEFSLSSVADAFVPGRNTVTVEVLDSDGASEVEEAFTT